MTQPRMAIGLQSFFDRRRTGAVRSNPVADVASATSSVRATWLKTGDQAFQSMLHLIREATTSIRLETYICSDCALTREFREALIDAVRRGVQVSVMIDALGSLELSDEFWQPLVDAGGRFCVFNPIALKRIAFRNHRKLLVCDDRVAVIGGFNLAEEYQGDGVTQGWRDLGAQFEGPVVQELAASFDLLWTKAHFPPRAWQLLKPNVNDGIASGSNWKLLLNIPSFHRRNIKKLLVSDLRDARSVKIVAAYFLPTFRIRQQLRRIARTGGRVQLLLAGKSDVRLAQLASHNVYDFFLRCGAEIHEYQPQILHAKLVIIDDVVYVGSCNLDMRSLNYNYELMVRIKDPDFAAEARDMFEADLRLSRFISREEWRRSRSLWEKLRERWAHFILARVDPWIARWQLGLLR